MRVIVIGAGEVGTAIAEALHRDNDVVVIERDHARYEFLQQLDILVIEGHGGSPQTLKEAGIEKADLLIACTDVDEVNIVACATAKQLGSSFTVARVQDPDYLDHWVEGYLGVDFMVCSELSTAKAIAMNLTVPEAKYVNEFANGKILMTEVPVRKGSVIMGLTVLESQPPPGCTIASIIRDNQIIIPGGDEIILDRDLLVNIGTPEAVLKFNARLSGSKRVRNVVIIGGGRIGYRLAKLLEKKGMAPYLIETDADRCLWLSEHLHQTLVLNHDGTDLAFLQREKVHIAEVAVNVTSTEEKNLLGALLLKRLGVERVIVRVEESSHIQAFEMVGVDVAINPRKLIAEEIVRFTRQQGTAAVSMLEEERAEVLELEIPENSKVANRPLSDKLFPAGTIVGAIVRGDEVISPRGDSELLANDHAIIFAEKDKVKAVEALVYQ
jgi:trk system potassium uptake protein TrkA